MRKNRHEAAQNEFSILALDDDPIMTATIQSYFTSAGYHVDVENDPLAAIERVRDGKYDILLLDFLMTPLCGDQVVERIRAFNHDLFIILLTGHKSMAPPIRTVRLLDIQGYYEKSDRFDQLELLVESCVKSIRQMRLIRSYQQSLTDMAGLMPDIYNLQETDGVGQQILDGLSVLWECSGGLLVIWPEADAGRQLRFLSGEQFAACDGADADALLAQAAACAADGKLLSSVISGPDGTPMGLIVAGTKEVPDFYQEQLFRIYVRQCTASLKNTVLTRRLKDSYIEIIQALRLMVDAKDIYTCGHSDRVAYYSELLAGALGMDAATCERIHIAGLFHDIGKMAIPDNILLSPSILTKEEFAEIRKHPEYGESMLSAIYSFKEIAPIVRSHHERIDGKGYPDGLTGDRIPPEARIISIADTFDAMISYRRYRPNLSYEETTRRLLEARGTQLDAGMVDVFMTIIDQDLPNKLDAMMHSGPFEKKVF